MRKTKLTLLLLAALLVGVCIGFTANNAIIQARIRHFSRIPGNMPEHITQKLTERLNLDDEQRAQVLAVFTTYDTRLQEIRDQSRATFDALRQEMTAQIDQYLTPAQVAEHTKMLDELEQRRQENRALRRAMGVSPSGPSNAPAK